MATGKRYYWIKLKDTFMTSDAVDFLMSQKDGANYVVLYQILCLKTINTHGRLERHIGEVIVRYDESKIQRDAKWFSIDTIRIALELYKALGLIYVDQDDVLCLTDHSNLVGSETDYAQQKRIQRESTTQQDIARYDKLQQANADNVVDIIPDNVVDNGVDIVHTDIRDKILDNRYKTIDTRVIENGTEPSVDSVLTMTLNDGSEYPITQKYVDQMQRLYPAVDVMQELRSMKAWCINNPTKRKTRNGIKRFIGNWLSKEQDRGGKGTQKKPSFLDLEI